MDITYTIDWYSVTLDPDNQGYVQRVVVLGDRLGKPTRKPQFGYDEIAQFESGAVLMWSNARKDMGAHLIMSGAALRFADRHGQSCEDVVKACNALGGRCSRIDLAIDVYDAGWTLETLSKSRIRPYTGKGRTPKYVPVGTNEDGFTVYIGSRSSESFLRIYDKSKEMGDNLTDVKRIEIECKGMKAHWIGSELGKNDNPQTYAMCSTLVRSMVMFDDPTWEQALSAERVEMGVPKKQGRDTLGWLVKSCAPALARAIAEKPNENVMGEFWEALKRRLKEYDLDIE